MGVQDLASNGAQVLRLEHTATSELCRRRGTDLSHTLLMAVELKTSDVLLLNFQPGLPRSDRQRKRQVGRSRRPLWLFEADVEALEIMAML